MKRQRWDKLLIWSGCVFVTQEEWKLLKELEIDTMAEDYCEEEHQYWLDLYDRFIRRAVVRMTVIMPTIVLTTSTVIFLLGKLL